MIRSTAATHSSRTTSQFSTGRRGNVSTDMGPSSLPPHLTILIPILAPEIGPGKPARRAERGRSWRVGPGACILEGRSATRTAMDPKPRPNHRLYLEILRSMTPEQKLLKVFELSEFSKALFTEGLRQRFPNATEEEF